MKNITLTSDEEDDFKAAIEIAFKNKYSREVSAVAYSVKIDKDKNKCFVFYHSYNESDRLVTPLPFPMNAQEATNFAWGWLQRAQYCASPDTDGSAEKGFTIEHDSHGAGDDWKGLLSITPTWIVYGK